MTTVALRRGTMMPYNAQATLHAYDALWGLLLPCTVHGRVTDIWRAYFTQRLLWDIGSRIAFATPWVTQYRNAHNYLADFNSELPLYQQAGALIDAPLAWCPTSETLPGRLEELYVLMYEMNILQIGDVKLAQAWLADLVALGYRFPPIERGGGGGGGDGSVRMARGARGGRRWRRQARLESRLSSAHAFGRCRRRRRLRYAYVCHTCMEGRCAKYGVHNCGRGGAGGLEALVVKVCAVWRGAVDTGFGLVGWSLGLALRIGVTGDAAAPAEA